MINFGAVPAGAVLPIMFTTYAAATGASVTLTGLAVTDIEVYKGTSMTQRASDAGFTLMDTDGIDIDTTTGLHGFSIDTGDNTDAGFYAAGSFYNVVVNAVTVDGQTVVFIAATFRLVAAEATAGLPSVNTTHAAGTAWGSGAITAASLASDAITAAKVASDVGTEIATAVLTTQMTEAYRADGAAPTLAQAACETLSHLGEVAISGTTKTIKKFDGTTTAATFTLDSGTTPTTITRAS